VTAKAESAAKLQARIDELEGRLARADKTVQALREVGLALGTTLDLDQLLELILKKITEILEADRATLYLLDEHRGRLLSRIMIGDEARSIELPIGEGIAGYVAKVGRTVRVKDAYRDKRFQREWDEVTGYRTRSILAAPMKNHVGRTIGVIQVLNKRGPESEPGRTSATGGKRKVGRRKRGREDVGDRWRSELALDEQEADPARANVTRREGEGDLWQEELAFPEARGLTTTAGGSRESLSPKESGEVPIAREFSQHDEELLTALATQAAVSIDNSRLFLSVIQKNMQLVETKEQLEHRVSDLKLLFELESAMGRAGTLEDLARAVVTEAARACEAQAGGLLIDEPEGGVWLYFVDAGSRRDGVEVRRIAQKRGEGVIGWAMSHNEAVSLPPEYNRSDDAPISSRRAQILGVSIQSAIAVPLEGEDGVPIGAMGLFNSRKASGFSQDDRALLRLVSANASTAVRLFCSRVERERSERLTSIGRLLSGVMHDMRTPLTVISGYVQLMALSLDPNVRAEHAKLILKQFDAISAMQREVLEFARGERSILLRRVYLTKFFGEVELQIMQELAGTKVKLVMEVEDRGVARFDEAKMTRVAHNLVRNAVEAMGEGGGTITVRAYRDEGDLVVSFADTGKGVPKEIEGKLFQSFVTAGKKRGTGLGLAIVKKIVDEHSGTIVVDSSSKGATFTIRLPQETVPVPSARSADLEVGRSR
jgi:signal transduction histidine kinase/putative methionine-R-sulfoxide reductase with GAF domain